MININFIKKMMHSPVYNYIVPGLTSWLIGEPNEYGKVRVFTCDRNHQESIVPHSHRYDFQCVVLKGEVKNIIWNECDFEGDDFVCSTLKYKDKIGEFEIIDTKVKRYTFYETTFKSADCYYMSSDEIHSIKFIKHAFVLFFEGETKKDTSIMLEPYYKGQHIPTGEVQNWMFQRN